MLCVNPLTDSRDGETRADANSGSLVPNEDMNNAALMPGLIPARCNEQGLPVGGQPPGEYGHYILPGNNYHIFDFMLFRSNLRADVERHVTAYQAAAQ